MSKDLLCNCFKRTLIEVTEFHTQWAVSRGIIIIDQKRSCLGNLNDLRDAIDTLFFVDYIFTAKCTNIILAFKKKDNYSN